MSRLGRCSITGFNIIKFSFFKKKIPVYWRIYSWYKRGEFWCIHTTHRHEQMHGTDFGWIIKNMNLLHEVQKDWSWNVYSWIELRKRCIHDSSYKRKSKKKKCPDVCIITKTLKWFQCKLVLIQNTEIFAYPIENSL